MASIRTVSLSLFDSRSRRNMQIAADIIIDWTPEDLRIGDDYYYTLEIHFWEADSGLRGGDDHIGRVPESGSSYPWTRFLDVPTSSPSIHRYWFRNADRVFNNEVGFDEIYAKVYLSRGIPNWANLASARSNTITGRF